jgi:5'-nucleotidase
MKKALSGALAFVALVSSCSDDASTPSLPTRASPDADPPALPAEPDAATAPPGPVTVRILGINDFHGTLDPAAGAPDVGGAAWLAAHVAKQRTATTFFLSAGDLIGASQLESGLFHDEPTIEIMNAIGLDFDGVGNHEFDEGRVEIERMQSGGCHPTDGCKSAASFPGAKFEFLAANVINKATGKTVFPAYEIRNVGGVNIAFVGLTLEGTPAVSLASAVADLEFRDEADTVKDLVPELRGHGAEVLVVMIHQGGRQNGSIDECTGLTGPIVDVVQRMPDEVKLVLSGHQHTSYNCKIGNKVVTSAGARGQVMTVADLTIDPSTLATSVTAHNIAITHDVAPDPKVQQILGRVATTVKTQREALVGTITETLASANNAAGEAPLGLLIADAMLDATKAAPLSAQIALMNLGGVRAPFVFAKSGSETVDGQVTFGEAYATQPFSNELMTISVTGADIVKVLDASLAQGRGLQPAGLTYAWTPNAAVGSRVLTSDVLVGGVPIVTATTYRVTVNSIVVEFFSQPSMITGAGVDLDALVTYMKNNSPIAPRAPRISTK